MKTILKCTSSKTAIGNVWNVERICRVTVKRKDYRESGGPAGPPGPPEVITGVLMTDRRVDY